MSLRMFLETQPVFDFARALGGLGLGAIALLAVLFFVDGFKRGEPREH